MNYLWNYEPSTPEQEAAVKQLSETVGLNATICRLLLQRGISTADAVQHYFRPQITELHDPFLMNDMDVAVNRLNEAIGRKERIMVYGDYDVDGCTAVALVYRFLTKFHSNVDYYIPDRYDEGYGVSMTGVDYAIAYAQSLGIDFIICDHHVPDEQLPPAVAILNAKRRDSTYPFLHLSGCGVGFKFMQAFAMNNDISFTQLQPLLDLCAVSIASDIVPIVGENRILAYHGLRQLNNKPTIGLKAIINSCGLQNKEVTMSDIIFKIGPRINASGRMQNGKESVALLVENDYRKAAVEATRINRYNEERKELDKKMTEEANSIVESMVKNQQAGDSIVIYNEDWHKGVIGIVASRITEVFFRPAVVLTRSGDLITGSARSVSGFDVYKAIEQCKDLLENFGGHTYAAGLSLKLEHLDEFRERFNRYVSENINPKQTSANLDIDAVISFRDITPKFCADIKRMRPFGPENPKPIFCTRQVYDYGTSKVVGREQEHIKLELVDNTSSRILNGIAFGQSSQARYIKTKQSFDIAYTIEENAYRKGEVQLQIIDIRPRPAQQE